MIYWYCVTQIPKHINFKYTKVIVIRYPSIKIYEYKNINFDFFNYIMNITWPKEKYP